MISAFMLTLNEEEVANYALDCFALVADQIDVLSVVDNGSTDSTRDILDFYRAKLPIVIQSAPHIRSHGELRNLALTKCAAPWIWYLDADETVGSNFRDWLLSGDIERSDIWEFHKYSTVGDCWHHAGGDGPSQRLFRNLSGVTFRQLIHTEPSHPDLMRKDIVPGVFMFDATSCKSREALYAKGARYQWGKRAGVEAIGGPNEYTDRIDDAVARNTILELPENVKKFIFTGPGFRQ